MVHGVVHGTGEMVVGGPGIAWQPLNLGPHCLAQGHQKPHRHPQILDTRTDQKRPVNLGHQIVDTKSWAPRHQLNLGHSSCATNYTHQPSFLIPLNIRQQDTKKIPRSMRGQFFAPFFPGHFQFLSHLEFVPRF